MGMLAKLNHKVFLRQDLISGFYGLLRDRFWYPSLDQSITPNSDYFMALLWKRLLGVGVLSAVPGNTTSAHGRTQTADGLITYAHCSRDSERDAGGGLAVVIINYLNTSASAGVRLGNATVSDGTRHDYVLTAVTAPSDQGVRCNGATM